jgi:hypothetical protein
MSASLRIHPACCGDNDSQKGSAKMSGSCSKVIATLFGILFIFSVLVGMAFYQIEYVLLQPDAYIDAIQEGDLPDKLNEIAATELGHTLERDPCTLTKELCRQLGGPPAYLAQLSQQDWKQILDLLITPEWIRDQSEGVVQGLFDALDPGVSSASITIDLQPIKDRMRGNTGTQVITTMLGSLPTCTQEQIAQLSNLLLTGGDVNQLLICSPPPEIQEITLPIISQQMSLAVAEIPNQIDFDLTGLGAEGSGINTLRRSMRQGILVSAVLAAGSLFMMLAFAVRSLRNFFVWLGWPLLSAGVIALAISLSVRASSGFIFSTYIGLTEMPMLQPETLEFIRELVQAVVSNVLSGLVFLSAVIALSGGLSLIVSRLFASGSASTSVNQRPGNLY